MPYDKPLAPNPIPGGLLALALFAFAASSAAALPQIAEPVALAEADQSLRAPVTVLEIVVKFRDNDKTKAIVDAFWSQPGAAQVHFDEFKRAYPDLATARLVRVTYSGELVLAFPCSEVSLERRTKAARDLAARLAQVPDISYAEPDLAFLTQAPPVR